MGCCLGNRDESIDDDLYGCNTIDELIKNFKKRRKGNHRFFFN